MDAIWDITINLIAALIGFLIGWGWQKLRKEVRIRKARKFWQPFVEDGAKIIIGRHTQFDSFEPSGFVGVGSAMALTELNTFFDSLGLRNIAISYADRIDGDSLKTNLMLLDGPDANSISREATLRIKTSLKFGDSRRHEIAIYDSTTRIMYAPARRIDSKELGKDFGVIFKTSNPFAPNKHILLIAGSFGYGTWAAVRFATSKQFIEHPIVATGKNVECLIETDLVRETPQDIKLVILRQIDDEPSFNSYPPSSDEEKLEALYEILTTRLSEGELRSLAFDLNIGYDDLGVAGDSKNAKARALVEYVHRQGRLSELQQVVVTHRPSLS